MLTRTENLTKSLQDWITTKLNAIPGYAGSYEFQELYPSERKNPLDKTIVVLGHSDSAPAQEAELGGPLTIESITFHVDVFGQDMRWGRNIAGLIKEILESGQPIPLNDYSTPIPVEIDKIPRIVDAIHARPKFTDPKPWQQHWNFVTFTVDHEYNRSYLA